MSKTIDHKQAREYLQALTDGLDIDVNHNALEAHLETCSQCRAYAAELNALEASLGRVLHARWEASRPPELPQPRDILRTSKRKVRQKQVFGLAGAVVMVALIVISLIGTLNWYVPQFSGQPDKTSAATGTPIGEIIAPTASPQPTPSEDTQNSPKDLPAGAIVFQSQRDGNDEIYLMNAGGNGEINLTDHCANDTSPAWSPDGQRLAFMSDRSGKPEIFTMDISTRNTSQLTDSPSITWFPPLPGQPFGAGPGLRGSFAFVQG